MRINWNSYEHFFEQEGFGFRSEDWASDDDLMRMGRDTVEMVGDGESEVVVENNDEDLFPRGLAEGL